MRPILANHCFKCHGPDDQARQAGLRLDQRTAAVAAAESGAVAIIPGKSDESELIRRICATDADQQMPPAVANKPLSDAQRETLRAWVAAGSPTNRIGRSTRPAGRAAAGAACQLATQSDRSLRLGTP